MDINREEGQPQHESVTSPAPSETHDHFNNQTADQTYVNGEVPSVNGIQEINYSDDQSFENDKSLDDGENNVDTVLNDEKDQDSANINDPKNETGVDGSNSSSPFPEAGTQNDGENEINDPGERTSTSSRSGLENTLEKGSDEKSISGSTSSSHFSKADTQDNFDDGEKYIEDAVERMSASSGNDLGDNKLEKEGDEKSITSNDDKTSKTDDGDREEEELSEVASIKGSVLSEDRDYFQLESGVPAAVVGGSTAEVLDENSFTRQTPEKHSDSMADDKSVKSSNSLNITSHDELVNSRENIQQDNSIQSQENTLIEDDRDSSVKSKSSTSKDFDRMSINSRESLTIGHEYEDAQSAIVPTGVVTSESKSENSEKVEDGSEDVDDVETMTLGEETMAKVRPINDSDKPESSTTELEESFNSKSDVEEDDYFPENGFDAEGDFTNELVYDLFDTESDDSDTNQSRLKKRESTLSTLSTISQYADGPEFPTYAADFNSLFIREEIMGSMQPLGMSTPTDLQATCLPKLLKWQDCVIQAPPGSGKTLAYVLTILQLLPRTSNRASAKSGVRALVVCPTREVGTSIEKEFQRLSQNMTNASIVSLLGGTMEKEQRINMVNRRPNVVIATPGKIAVALKKNLLRLSQLKTLVIEHSDIMLQVKEFRNAVNKIFKVSQKKKQVILVSTTTIPPVTMTKYTKSPFQHITEKSQIVPSTLHHYYTTSITNDLDFLSDILTEVNYKQALVFANTTADCDQVTRILSEKNLTAAAYYGSLKPADKILLHSKFSDNLIKVLVTTDILSRPTVTTNVDLVVNYSCPTHDAAYVHRATRAVATKGQSAGMCVTFLKFSDVEMFQKMEADYGFSAKELPTNLSNLRGEIERARQTHEEVESEPVAMTTEDVSSPTPRTSVVPDTDNGREEKADSSVTPQAGNSRPSSSAGNAPKTSRPNSALSGTEPARTSVTGVQSDPTLTDTRPPSVQSTGSRNARAESVMSGGEERGQSRNVRRMSAIAPGAVQSQSGCCIIL